MAKSNFERMIELVTEVFDSRNDPEQLDVDEQVIAQLQQLHPATLSEYDEGEGPCVWILIIPTSTETMHLFLEGKIAEGDILKRTRPGAAFEAIYLCSASTLTEYRGRGIAKRLTLEAIESIRKEHNIDALYVWPFSQEGEMLAQKIAQSCGLPLQVKH